VFGTQFAIGCADDACTCVCMGAKGYETLDCPFLKPTDIFNKLPFSKAATPIAK